MASVEGRAETLASVHSTLRESFLASDIAENPQIPRSLARVTLAAVLNNESKSPSNSNVVRTLLDIIRAEETLANHPNQHHQFTGSRTTWRSLKDRLKLRRNTGSNPTCSLNSHSDWMPTASDLQPDATAPQPQLEVSNRSSVRDSLQMADSPGAEGFEEDGLRRRSVRLSDALAAEREERSRMSRELEATAEEGGSGGVNGGEPAREQEPIRMSLMDLLEESERHSGIQGPTYSFDDDDEAQGVEEPPRYVDEEDEKGVAGVSEISCCVCMVRHKGAAFIPCGHTFCRMCSRELWVQRGHCPLCNSFILEVLDIF